MLAHTNLAEFNKFLQEKENEALLDRMVIVKVPYTLSFNDEARIYRKLVSSAPAFRKVHFDPHVLDLAAVFSILTRLQKPQREGSRPHEEAEALRRRGRRGVHRGRSAANQGGVVG